MEGEPYDEDYNKYIEVPVDDVGISAPSQYMSLSFGIHSILSHIDLDWVNENQNRQKYFQFLTDFEGQNYWKFTSSNGNPTQVDGSGTPLVPENPDNPDNPDNPSGGSGFDDSNIVAGLGGVQNSVDNMTNSVDNMNGYLQNGDMSGNDLNIDSNFNLDTEENPNEVFTQILSAWQNTFESLNNSDVITVNIPVPFTDKNLTLRSDILSHVLEGSAFYTIIQTFWWALFGWYFLMFSYRIIEFFTSGEMLEGGGKLSAFLKYIEDQNTVIKANMM